MTKKLISLLLVLVLAFSLVACSKGDDKPAETATETKTEDTKTEEKTEEKAPEASNETITVISREDGSGTRGAFIEIAGIEEKDGDTKVDKTTVDAVVQKSTNAVLMTVNGDKNAIGYISLGSLNDSVKAVKVEGVEATADDVLDGSYKIARPFNIVYKGELDGLKKDFVDFMMSKEGQDMVLENKYVQVDTAAPEYKQNSQSGKLVVGGSTSVTPLMEKFAEKYMEMYPDVKIEIQSTGSSAGIQAAIEGAADLGMASRDVSDEEKAELNNIVIAKDGIAVIVNNENAIEDLTLDQIKGIFVGDIKTWGDIK
ncbi:substrate-binding domain-containing protein [uncultured Fenollaria sp.]|uniref:substrate-binding domain-containing protein n=1 Tax=uncultured Fenollaria sp. TaxID=1686315 RepID=UPI0025CEC1B5|nr:substrate-binding domain-containing protein [uncultured Fenollaria sp.]